MSILSDVAICNLALDACGARSTITSLQENSKEAKACARQYSPALAAVLQAASWNFARAQVSLTLLKDGTLTPPDSVPTPWVYEYAYPSDCIQARYIMPLIQSSPGSVVGALGLPSAIGSPVRFLVGTDLDSSNNRVKVILTNQPNAILVYSTLITDTSLFDEQFTRAFANYLGHLLCIPLSGDKALAKMAYQVADEACKKAEAANGNEGLTVIDNLPDWIRVRGYASDWAYPPGSYFVIEPQALTMIT